ncbi:MAG: hypothetical protein GY841_02545 [FCB group bacterium]|nr:hypothetical protein [FCB group bacterium]
MEYYCYISQTKVDQLLAELGEKNPIDWIEDTTKKSDKHASGGLSKLLAIFGADLSYGRSDVFQTKVTLKLDYVNKLKTVLKRLSPEVIELESISGVDFEPGKMYLYRNEFIVTKTDNDHLIAHLEAEDDNRKLVLHSSLKFFSESPVKDGAVRLHSTNYAFFTDQLPVTFETVFLFLSLKGAHVIGSPLYLKLSSRQDLLL